MSTQLAEVAEQKQASPSSEREGDEYSMTEVHLSEHDIDSDSDSDIVLKPSSGNGKVNNSFGKVSQPGGTFQVDWRNIKFHVEKKVKKETQTLHILKGISGAARPGRFTAILGASGAGKSSFLNILAGRLRSHADKTVTGEILVNGESLDQREFEQNTAYVMQHDALMETLTPREAFTFAAQLRLPKTMSLDEKHATVDEMLTALDLNKCADSYIGGHMLQGISGGERKRVSIGIELITNPSIIFVDEPTSGLDSFTAYQTVELLVNLAHSGRTVISTIHQPNSTMFDMFDDLIVVAEGQIMYTGPAKDAAEYFAKLGHVCPPRFNPADYFIDLVHGREDVNLDLRMELAQKAHRKLIQPIVNANLDHLKKKKSDEPSESDSVNGKKSKRVKAAGKHEKASTFEQLKLLSWRTAVNFRRQPVTGKVRIFNNLFFGFVMGILFFQLDRTNRAVGGRVGAMFSTLLNQAMGTMMTVILTFPVETVMFQRERANGMYSTFSYFFAKVIVEIPYIIMYTTIFVVIVVPMIGFGESFDQALKFWFMLLTAAMVAYSLGILIGAIMPNPNAAQSASAIFILPFILFSGFFVNIDDMPVWISWLSYLSWVKYAIEALVVNEFTSDFNVSDCLSRDQPGCNFSNGDEVLEFYGYDDVNYWEWWAVLMGMFAFYLLVGLFSLRAKAKAKSREPLKKEEAIQDV